MPNQHTGAIFAVRARAVIKDSLRPSSVVTDQISRRFGALAYFGQALWGSV